MRVALFVEGSTGLLDRDGNDFFIELWKTALVTTLGLRAIDLVFPISKKHIIAMDPANPKMSGASEPLDEYIARNLASNPFDAAIVAWDLQPAWQEASVAACRWKETLEFYRLLAESVSLPAPWVEWARSKSSELSSRAKPSDRPARPRLCANGIFAVCMEPVFEALLLGSEGGIRRALGVDGVRVPGWPANWSAVGVRPEIAVLQTAILSAKRLVPRRRKAHIVSGDMRTAKHEWAKLLLTLLSEDAAARSALLQQPTAGRLLELLPQVEPPRAKSGQDC